MVDAGGTARNTIVHPVVLRARRTGWNFTGLGLHPIADEMLVMLSAAVVPLCLVLIGVTLAEHGGRGLDGLRGLVGVALGPTLLKLFAQPALVLVVARWGFGLDGLALSVVVMMSALPVGSNALLFAQRYATRQAPTTAAIVLSTLAFAASASVWLWLLRLVA